MSQAAEEIVDPTIDPPNPEDTEGQLPPGDGAPPAEVETPAEPPVAAPAPTPAAPAPVTPASPAPVAQRPQAPAYQPPQQIQRAREQFKKLDETMGTNGQFSEAVGGILDLNEQLARDNAALRARVQQHESSLGGMSFWQTHDADPANAAYPSRTAQSDYARITQEVAADPAYSGMDDSTRALAQDIASRERFFAHRNSRRTAPAANNPAEPPPAAPATAVAPVQRQVGATRVMPRGTQPVKTAPARRMTVEQMLTNNALPADVLARAEQELGME